MKACRILECASGPEFLQKLKTKNKNNIIIIRFTILECHALSDSTGFGIAPKQVDAGECSGLAGKSPADYSKVSYFS